MKCFFCWIPYSLRNSLKKFENFYQPDRPVGNRFSQFDEFQLKFIIGAGLNSKHSSLFWSYLPHLNLESHTFFFRLLIIQEIFCKNFRFFLNLLNWLELVQPDHYVSLYGALILEPKSYLIWAHKLQISPRHGLGLVLGYLMGCLQPTLSTFWILGG